jgi:hypothetical protein
MHLFLFTRNKKSEPFLTLHTLSFFFSLEFCILKSAARKKLPDQVLLFIYFDF